MKGGWGEVCAGGSQRKSCGNRSSTVTAVYYLLLVTTCGEKVKSDRKVCVYKSEEVVR